MSAARLPAAVRDLLRAAPDAAADADLLARFVAARDEAAFAGLVRRHGATVWDVCRSVLGNRADADDAFQAVFLTLARRAAALRKPASVGAWLHGVAVRVARKARAAALRRQLREAHAPLRLVVEEPDPSWAEVRAAVHDALAALPGVYREPLVACYLRGLTQDDAAAELGLTKGAVKKRLERGRDRLRAALTRRGVAPAAVLAVGAAPAAAVPDHLLDAVPRLAVGAAPVPNTILRLVEGGTSMSFAKLTAALGLFAAVGLAVAAGQERSNRLPVPKTGDPPPTGARAARDRAAAETPQTDRTKLAGEWTVKWIETSGEALFDLKNHDETLPPPKFVFSGNRCEVMGVKVLFVRDFTFTTDETKAPKEIDATFLDGPKKGETFVGIYVLRGDELRVCLRLQGVQFGRPKGFATNSGTTLYTFVLTRAARTAPADPRGTTAPPPLPPGPAPVFDEVLRSGNKLYFVLNRPGPERFEDDLAAVGQRLDHAVKTAEGFPNVTVVFFKRTDPKATEGSHTGMSQAQLREVARLPVGKRADKLLEHAWTIGRLPKDAVPLPQPRGDRPAKTAATAPRYHAYWLTSRNAEPRAASEYPVLLLTRMPLDEFAEQAVRVPFTADWPAEKLPPLLDQSALTLTTYAKDSVWNVDMRPLAPVRRVNDFRPKERTITLNDTPYRYESADLNDVVRLLERPEGTRPIHRIHAPLTGVEQTARALKHLLQEQLRDEAAKE